jgi:hypothetical protein
MIVRHDRAVIYFWGGIMQGTVDKSLGYVL